MSNLNAFSQLLLDNLKLLNFELKDLNISSTSKSLFNDAKINKKLTENILHFLFTKLDKEATEKKFLNIYPTINDRNKQREFFMVSVKFLEELKKLNKLPSDCLIRKSLFDECKGERFEKTILSLSNLVLITVIANEYHNIDSTSKNASKSQILNLQPSKETQLSEVNDLMLKELEEIYDLLAEDEKLKKKFKNFSAELLSLKSDLDTTEKELLSESSKYENFEIVDLERGYNEKLAIIEKKFNWFSEWVEINKTNLDFLRKFTLGETKDIKLDQKHLNLDIPQEFLKILNENENNNVSPFVEGKLDFTNVIRIFNSIIMIICSNLEKMNDDIQQNETNIVNFEDKLQCEISRLEKLKNTKEYLLKHFEQVETGIFDSEISYNLNLKPIVELPGYIKLSAASLDIPFVDQNYQDEIFQILSASVPNHKTPDASITADELSLKLNINSVVEDLPLSPAKTSRNKKLKPEKKIKKFVEKKKINNGGEKLVLQKLSDNIALEMLEEEETLTNSKLLRSKKNKNPYGNENEFNLNIDVLDKAGFQTKKEIPRTPLHLNTAHSLNEKICIPLYKSTAGRSKAINCKNTPTKDNDKIKKLLTTASTPKSTIKSQIPAIVTTKKNLITPLRKSISSLDINKKLDAQSTSTKKLTTVRRKSLSNMQSSLVNKNLKTPKANNAADISFFQSPNVQYSRKKGKDTENIEFLDDISFSDLNFNDEPEFDEDAEMYLKQHEIKQEIFSQQYSDTSFNSSYADKPFEPCEAFFKLDDEFLGVQNS
ncbi:hypothetical protein HDU92_005467 [Lobulomyces angularis]|nr:hypothetical protein HDU92_005467 [Lobulomyces angularis]